MHGISLDTASDVPYATTPDTRGSSNSWICSIIYKFFPKYVIFPSIVSSIYYDIHTEVLIYLLLYYSIAVDGINVDTGGNVPCAATQETTGASHS